MCDPIVRLCWSNEKVRVKPTPIEVIDRRVVIWSKDFWPWEKRRPMEFRSTRVFSASACGSDVQCTIPQACQKWKRKSYGDRLLLPLLILLHTKAFWWRYGKKETIARALSCCIFAGLLSWPSSLPPSLPKTLRSHHFSAEASPPLISNDGSSTDEFIGKGSIESIAQVISVVVDVKFESGLPSSLLSRFKTIASELSLKSINILERVLFKP